MPSKDEINQGVRNFLGNYLRLILGILALIFGLASMLVPFIPLGYVLVFVAVLFLSTYIPPLKRLLDKLKEKDDKGIIDKYDQKMDDVEDDIENNGPDQEKGKQGSSQHSS